jgi:hypothetical protein
MNTDGNDMSWNHRVIRLRYDEGEYVYNIHSVHYNHNGDIKFWSSEPLVVGGDSTGDLQWVLNKMLSCLNKPVLEEVDGKLEEVE